MQNSIRLRRHLRAFHNFLSAIIFIAATLPSPIPLAFAKSDDSASKNPSASTTPSAVSSAPVSSLATYSTPIPITSSTLDSSSISTSTSSPAPAVPAPKSTSPTISTPTITITGRTLPIFKVSHTLTDSGDAVAQYGDKFLYGHNTAPVFRDLASLQIGSRFTISRSGSTKIYQIRHFETMTKSDTANFMWAIVHADFRGQTYDLSLMTCAGAPRPGRDATHRLILFADQI